MAGASAPRSGAFGIVGEPLAPWLIERARKHRVIDLSVQLSADLPVWWPGPGAGNSRYRYYQHVLPLPYIPAQHQRAYDSHVGTHLVPPAYALPREGFDPGDYSPQVRKWLGEYEKSHGPRGFSDITTEKVPLSQTAGWARVIDVKHLIGSTKESDWPASPVIGPGGHPGVRKAVRRAETGGSGHLPQRVQRRLPEAGTRRTRPA